MHPGRIAKKGIRTVKVRADGVMKEMVLIRDLPSGHWDVEFEDIEGASIQETHDDGSAIVTASQGQAKYNPLGNQGLSNLQTSSANAQLEQEAEFSDAGQVRRGSDDEMTVESSEDHTEDEEDDLSFARGLFHDGPLHGSLHAAKSHRKAAPAAASTPSRAASSSLRGAPHKRLLPTASSVSPSPSSASKRSEVLELAGGPREGKGRGRPRMFDKGASVEEVLDKHGLPQIQEREDAVKALLAAAPLDSVSVEATTYSTALQKVRQTAAEFNRKVVALRVKVKKWTDQPRELDEHMEAMFARSQMAITRRRSPRASRTGSA